MWITWRAFTVPRKEFWSRSSGRDFKMLNWLLYLFCLWLSVLQPAILVPQLRTLLFNGYFWNYKSHSLSTDINWSVEMLLHRGKIRFNNLFVTSPITKWKIIFHSFCLDLLSIKIGQLIGLLQIFKTRGLRLASCCLYR